jgi:glycosyltransferase involved in cell wall biosynthesis
MKKNIIIDASPVRPIVDGLSQYVVNLLKYIPESAFDEYRIRLLINRRHNNADFYDVLNTGKFDVTEDEIPMIGPKRDWWFYKFIRKNERNYDLLHSTSTQYPLSLKRKGIATVHDMTILKHYYQKNFLYRAAPVYFRHILKASLKNAEAVIAVSNATKEDLCNYYKPSKKITEKITVIYEGWEHLEKYADKAVLPFYKGYIFYLGSSRKHKNLERLIRAFFQAKPSLPPDAKLVISGDKSFLHYIHPDLSARISAPDANVHFTGYLSEEEVAGHYRNAHCFIFPSLVEGFGIPVLESFYYNTPLLCSNISSLPEVAGKAALYFDPMSEAEIAAALIKIYTEPQLAGTLRADGKEQLKKYSWKFMSEQIVDVYRKVLTNSKHG